MESSKRKGAGRRSLQRKEKSWMKASTAVVLAVVLAAVTVQSAALPEQTPEAETYCGKEEHVHTEECYAPVLVCGFPEETGSPEAEGEQKTLITEDGEQLVNIGETPTAEGQEPAEETGSGTPEEVQESEAEAGSAAPAEEIQAPAAETVSGAPAETQEASLGDGSEAAPETGSLESVPSEEVPKANELLEAPAGTYLACPLQVHVHSADCLDDFGNNLCGEADFVIHTHNGSCYDAEGNLVCTLPEIKAHTHDDTCYEVRQVLLCGQEETAGHTHTDDCYAWSTELICGQEESAGHTHTEECHQRETVLTCGQEESLGHTHTEECYQTERVLVCTDEFHEHNDSCYIEERILVCGQEESAGHTHSDACYTTTDMIVCGLEETPGHTHSESCYTQVKGELICGQEESAGHTHTDACFGEEKVKICGQDEVIPHTHTAECYAVLTEDYMEDGTVVPHVHTDACYNAAGWLVCGGLICGQIEVLEHEHGPECFRTAEVQDAEVQGTEVQDTGVQDTGAQDTEAQGTGAEDTGNQTPEVQDTGDQNPETQDTESQGPEDQNTGDQNPEVQDTETEENAGSPEAEQQDTEANQSEIEVGQEEETVHVHTDECYEMELVCGKEEHTHTEECYQEPDHTKTAQGDGYSVTVTYGPEAEIPENAVLTTMEFGEGTEEYAKRYAELTEKLNLDAEAAEISESVSAEDSSDEPENSDFGDDGEAAGFEDGEEITITGEETGEELSYMRLFDVAFMVDGVEFEPKAPVKIFFTFEDEETENTNIAHFGQNGVEILRGEETDDVAEENGEKTIGYTVDSFSPFAKYGTGTVPKNKLPINNSSNTTITQINNTERLDTNFEHNKAIDYLGDNTPGDNNTDNPDTDLDGKNNEDKGKSLTEDLYRLYLDMEGKNKPIDLLVIVDRSSSMTTPMIDKVRRDEAVYDVLTGADGLISKFLALNPQNNVAATWFGGLYPGYQEKDLDMGFVRTTDKETYSTDAGLVFGWKNASTFTGNEIKYDFDTSASDWYTKCINGSSDSMKGSVRALTRHKEESKDEEGKVVSTSYTEGTNYTAGLMYGSRILHEEGIEGNGHEKIVIFISDGIPTYFYTPDAYRDYSDLNAKPIKYGEAIEDKAISHPNDGYINGSDYKGFYSNTEGLFNAFMDDHKTVKFYTIGIDLVKMMSIGANRLHGEGADDYNNHPESFSRKTVLEYMSEKGRGGAGVFDANSKNELVNSIEQILFPKSVIIKDPLSDYVDLYSQHDVKVTKTVKTTGDVTVLWQGTENSIPTPGTTIVLGSEIIENNKWTDKRDGDATKQIVTSVTYDPSTKTIAANFHEDYALEAGCTYTLSFNVRVTDHAFDKYAQDNGYDRKGDEADEGDTSRRTDTDYGNNETSSGKEGFYSNSNAVVEYRIDGDKSKPRDSDPYKNPVVQVWKSELTLVKEDETGKTMTGVSFDLKKIDLEPGQMKNERPDLEVGMDGKLFIDGLTTGKYQLQEVGTKDGYRLLPEPIEFTVSRGRISYADEDGDLIEWEAPEKTTPGGTNQTYSYTLKVKNVPYETDIELLKVDNKINKSLEGATFVLERGIWKDGKFEPDTAEGKIEITKTTEMDGKLKFEKLRDGTYRLTETKAPYGYYLLKAPIVFTIKNGEIEKDGETYKFHSKPEEVNITVGEFTVEGEDPVHTFTITIPNNSGAVLPDTGGPGTILYTMAGVSLLLAGFMYSLQLRERRHVRARH